MKCLGQNFAYNEASFFLVRLLQQFDKFELAPEFQPAGSAHPAEWKAKQGRQSIEKCWPAAALTLYVRVSSFPLADKRVILNFPVREGCGYDLGKQAGTERLPICCHEIDSIAMPHADLLFYTTHAGLMPSNATPSCFLFGLRRFR